MLMTLYGEVQPGMLLGGRYRVEKELGRGAFGVVFRAVQEILGRPANPGIALRTVALKILVDKYVNAENAAEAFAEAIAMERLAAASRALGERPRVVEVFDVGVIETPLYLPYIAMEFAEGGSLEEQIHTEVPLKRAVALMREICAGVSIAHAHGIYHRDLKPANILYTKSGFLKVSDFGVMIDRHRAFHETGHAGTISYSPPDTGDAPVTTGTYDVYSLGLILLEFLLKRNPLNEVLRNMAYKPEEGSESLLEAQKYVAALIDPVTQTPFSEYLLELRKDAGILEIIRTCVAFEPERRYRDAGELDRALEQWQMGAKPAIAPRRDPSPQRQLTDLLREAEACGTRQEWKAALLLLQRAVRMDNSASEVHFRLSQVFEALQRWEEAVAAQERAISLAGRTWKSLEDLARLYSMWGQTGSKRIVSALKEEALRQRQKQTNDWI
jgi:serine/threonine protein kinase